MSHLAQPEESVNSFPCSDDQDNFPGNVFLSPDFVKHYGGAWIWPFPKPAPSPGDIRSALLNAAVYVDDALDAQIEGDDAKLLNAVEVLRSIADVVIGQMRKPSVTLQ
jgi:hypothetical protein